MTTAPLAADPEARPMTGSPAIAALDIDGEGSGFENRSVTRVGEILALFDAHTTEVTAAEIAERLGMNRTTAYRYLASLVAAGILERGRRRGAFVLGGLMLQLGIRALDRKRVVRIAPPHLRELSAATNMTAVLSVWGASTPLVAHVQEAPRQGALVTIRPGTHLGMTTSQMQVFLAHHGDERAVERLLAGLSEADRVAIEAAVYTVRRRGYGLVKYASGLFGAAAPVFDEYGLCASIGILGADQSADLSPLSPLVVALRRTAAAIGAELDSREGVPHARLR